jgi:cation diffusion facilitator family transporter
MGTASLALMKEGATAIGEGLSSAPPVLHVDAVTYAAMGTGVVLKVGLLALCWGLRHLNPTVGALALDHRNDALSNLVTLTSVAVAGSLGGSWWLVDPICACVIAVYVLTTWVETGWEQVRLLSGLSADPRTLSTITRIAAFHDPRVTHVELVRAYYFGTRLLVEVDVVMDRDTPLHIAHDVSESIQREVEAMDEVERAFVHVDYDAFHDPDDEHGLATPQTPAGGDRNSVSFLSAAMAAVTTAARRTFTGAAVEHGDDDQGDRADKDDEGVSDATVAHAARNPTHLEQADVAPSPASAGDVEMVRVSEQTTGDDSTRTHNGGRDVALEEGLAVASPDHIAP